ncbi:MAG: DEAD/DEAH box helicase [Cyanobacteria bacterium J06638_7]
MKLYDHQAEAIEGIRALCRQGARRVLLQLPTGGGKTVILAHLTAGAMAKGNRSLVLVHRRELLDQASDTLRRLGVPHGLIVAGRGMELALPVQVASIETVRRRLGRLPSDLFQFVMVDEAHHACSRTWREVLGHWPGATVLGVTATPARLDGRGLGEQFEAMVRGQSPAWLTEHGYLATARVFAPPLGFTTEGLRRWMGDYSPAQAAARLNSRRQMGDAIGHYRRLLEGRTAVAFCCSVAHAEQVAEAFAAAGIAAASIDGRMDVATRRGLLQALGSGEVKVLTSCSLIGEGIDVPSVGGCILLRPTASLALHLQMIGRCLRPGHGDAVVLDHVGNVERLGHHLDEQDWTLEGVRRRDRNAAPSVKTCPRCFSAVGSRFLTCPNCGFEWPPPTPRAALEQVEGELREVERRERMRNRRQEQAAARSYGDLVALGHARGHRNPEGWARHVLASRSVRAGRSRS